MSPKALSRFRWIFSAALLLVSSCSHACQICLAVPEKTLADRLLESNRVVMAREDPNRPFHFVVTETLKGKPPATPIEAFLNSQARRLLALYDDRHVLLIRDRRKGAWKPHGVIDSEEAAVVRGILSFSHSWRPMQTNNLERLAEFSGLLGHSNQRLRELAYLEIGRAPYAAIKRISADVPIEVVRSILDNPSNMEWHSLAILMLGHSESLEDQTRIIRTFEAKQQQSSSKNLAAWATAYVAIEGAEGMDRIETWYLLREDRSREELKEVVKALSVLGADNLALRDRIALAYESLMRTHPSLLPDLVRDLITWRRWELADQIRKIRNSMGNDDPLGVSAVDWYLRVSKRKQSRSRPKSSGTRDRVPDMPHEEGR
jgi:hypothetical protein